MLSHVSFQCEKLFLLREIEENGKSREIIVFVRLYAEI